MPFPLEGISIAMMGDEHLLRLKEKERGRGGVNQHWKEEGREQIKVGGRVRGRELGWNRTYE